ncbi:DUF7344 domain-containing protein [Natronorarus salvus]|uniref:DUF7344 domain-containing protein n=1 Tax=Natronorarus salvus TaxID=3117733 RepID=UPI002F262C8E
MSSDHTPKDRDELFQALADDRRQAVLACLAEVEGTLALADLANDVVAREGVESPASPPDAETETVYLSLYHRHVPHLADAGLVSYDPERELVGPGPRFDDLDSLLSGPDDTAADDD